MKHTMLQQMNTTKTTSSFSSFPVNQTKNIQLVLHSNKKKSIEDFNNEQITLGEN